MLNACCPSGILVHARQWVLMCPVPSKNLGHGLQRASRGGNVSHVLQQPIAEGIKCVLCGCNRIGPLEARI